MLALPNGRPDTQQAKKTINPLIASSTVDSLDFSSRVLSHQELVNKRFKLILAEFPLLKFQIAHCLRVYLSPMQERF